MKQRIKEILENYYQTDDFTNKIVAQEILEAIKEQDFTIADWFLIDDKWHHVAFTKEGDTLKKYLDGKELNQPQEQETECKHERKGLQSSTNGVTQEYCRDCGKDLNKPTQEAGVKHAEEFLDAYLGNNRNVSTLTWHHWIHCLADYAKRVKNQPSQSLPTISDEPKRFIDWLYTQTFDIDLILPTDLMGMYQEWLTTKTDRDGSIQYTDI